MNESGRGLFILIGGFALFVTAHTMQLSVASLIGAQYAPDKSMATLPLFTVMLGTALATVPASMLMKYVTRRTGFICGSVLAILGAGTAVYAVRAESFWLFIVGTGLIGMFNAFCQLYRFAGAELVPPERKGKAISFVLAGGILGGLLGPNLEAFSRGWFEISFMGPYVVIVCIGFLNIILMSFLDMGKPPGQLEEQPQRPLGEIVRQPVFIVAAMSAMVAFGVMASFMAGSPMIIQKFHHSHHQATSAISIHTMLMYTPALFVAALIARFGVLNIIGTGIAFQAAGFVVLYAGKSYTLHGVHDPAGTRLVLHVHRRHRPRDPGLHTGGAPQDAGPPRLHALHLGRCVRLVQRLAGSRLRHQRTAGSGHQPPATDHPGHLAVEETGGCCYAGLSGSARLADQERGHRLVTADTQGF
jgi:MFS family permease